MTKANKKLPDIQAQMSYSDIAINKVGVKDVVYPIVVLDKKKKEQHTIANINMYVDLPHYFRGTHMSRFLEVLNEYRGLINVNNMGEILSRIKTKLEAASAHMEISFPYFIEKTAPKSGAKGMMDYQCRFIGTHEEKEEFILEVQVPVTTLCPCSKEISDGGAHNQRCLVTVQLKWNKTLVWIEDIIQLIEKSASCQVYSLLKRSDEKYVTERAYNNPMFVEDLAREVAGKLKKDKNIAWFTVEAESLESIHNHSAYAFIEQDNSK